MAFRNRTSMNALRIFCALVFLSLGLGHKPVQAAAPSEAYSEAYRLPDGSFAEICADGQGQHGSRNAVLPVCERSEEHTSELQSLMRISYAVFCLKKKIQMSSVNLNEKL